MPRTVTPNVELLEETYQAFNDADIEAVTGRMDETIEWIEPEGLPFGGTHRGPEAVVESVFEPVMEQFERLDLDVDRVVDGNDTLVVLGIARGKVRETGEEYDIPFAHVHDMVDGHIVRFTQYTNTHLWREAIGV